MKTFILRLALILLLLFLTACSIPDAGGPALEAAGGARSTVAPPPPPRTQDPGLVEVTPPEELAEPDPYDGLSFKNGWARIPFNATVFGGYGADQINDVAAGGPGVIAVGFNVRNGDLDADVWISSDGIRWERIQGDPELGGGGTQVMHSVAVGPKGIVAVGMESIDNQLNGAVWFSEDGFSWLRIPEVGDMFGDQNNQVMNHVAAFGDGFVAVGIEKTDVEIRGAVWISPNGVAWQRVPHSEEVFGGLTRYVSLEDVQVVGESLLAVGTTQRPDVDDIDAAIWFSHDGGSTWTSISNSEAALGDPGAPRYQLTSAVTQGTGTFLMIGTEVNVSGTAGEQYINGIIWQSADGASWTRIFDHKPDFHQQNMNDIVATDIGFMIVGYESVGEQIQAAAWISPDGATWTQIPFFESVFGGQGIQQMNAIAEAGPGLVAVGSTTENGEQDAAVWVYVPEK